MNCYSSETIALFLDGQLPPGESAELESHLRGCTDCSSLVEHSREENEVLKGLWRENGGLDGMFTDTVMAKLSVVEMEDAGLLAPTARKSRRRRRFGYAAGIAAATVAAVLVAGSYASPAFASYLSSFFSSPIWHSGIKQAAQEGFVQSVGREAVSNGVTFRVVDLFADQSRILVSYEVLDQKGRLLNPEMPNPKGGKVNQAVLTDQQGTVLVESNGWTRDGERAVLEFPVPSGTYDELKLHIHFTQIGGVSQSSDNNAAATVYHGDWLVETPIEMKTINTASRVIPVNKQFVTPQGFEVTLRELKLHPSSFEAKIETSERAQLYYRFLSEDGRLLADSAPRGLPINDLDRVKFVLDAIETQEPADLQFDFDVKGWNGELQRFEVGGSMFVIDSFHKDITVDIKGRKYYELHLSGETPGEIKFYLWSIVDEQGTEFQDGGEIDDSAVKDGKRAVDQTIYLNADQPLPDKLTFKATHVFKRYSGFNWEEMVELK